MSGTMNHCQLCGTDILDDMELCPACAEKGSAERLAEAVRRFFSILDIVEVSDSGREFRPNYISSCRILDGHRIGGLLKTMERESGHVKGRPDEPEPI